MIKKNSEKIIKKSQNNEKKLNQIIEDLLAQNKDLKNDNSKITKKYRALKHEIPIESSKTHILQT